MNPIISNFWVISSAMVLCHLLQEYLLFNHNPASSRPLSTYLFHVLCLVALASFIFFSFNSTSISLYPFFYFYITFSGLVCYLHCCYICLPLIKAESSNHSVPRLILCLSLLSLPYCIFAVLLLSLVFSSLCSWRIIEDS